MKKRILILAAICLIAVGAGWWKYRADSNTLTANTPTKTGVSLIFNRSLTKEAIVEVNDSDGNRVKTIRLQSQGQQYNIELPAGVYQLSASGAGGSFPPTPTSTVTVSEGVLRELHLVVPAQSD